MTACDDRGVGSTAVFVVAYRAAEKLARCLESVQRFLPEQEIHVWDNSGPDYSEVRELARDFPHAHWYLDGENIGFAAAVNNLAAIVSDQDFLLLNPDAELVGSLALTRAAIGDPDTAAAAPLIWADVDAAEAPSRKHQPWDVAHRRRTVLNALGERAIAAERMRGTWLSNLYRIRPVDVDGYLTGACLAVRRDAWDALGPFDDEFFLYGEEADWQTRAIAAGWRVRLADETGIRHSAQGTVAGDPTASTRSSDLVDASIALQVQHRRGVSTADLYLAGTYVVDAAKRALRLGDRHEGRSDVVLVVDGPRSPSASALVSRALALAGQGRAVTVVSLRGLGALPRELPASIRLLRRPWWWPRTWPGDAPNVLIAGLSGRERAAARLFRFRRRTVRVESVDPVRRSGGLDLAIAVPNRESA